MPELCMRNGAVKFILEQGSGLSNQALYDRTRHMTKDRDLADSQPYSIQSPQNLIWIY